MFARIFGGSKKTPSATADTSASGAATTTTSNSNQPSPHGPNEGSGIGGVEGIDTEDIAVSVPIAPPPPEPELNFDINVQIGGGKGWPSDVTVVFYHRLQGLICLGTAGGAVYACGDGFQYLRPWLTEDPNSVIAIVSPTSDSILVVFADNSLAVLDLPTLNVVDLLPGTWLNSRTHGEITSVYVDEPAGSAFVFIGTSRACVCVCEIVNIPPSNQAPTGGLSIRLCEFMLTSQDLGINLHTITIPSGGAGGASQQQTIMQTNVPCVVTEISVCPKDTKYIAIGLTSADKLVGKVCVFNVLKQKIKTVHDTLSISCVCWDHTGESLFVGSRGGKLYVINIEKHSIGEIWNTAGECEENDGVDGATEGGGAGAFTVCPSIKRLVWYANQTATDEPCLFALLSTDGQMGLTLKSAIVGLAPIGDHGEMQLVFTMSPIMGEEVIGFRLVSTLLTDASASAGASSSNSSNTNNNKPVPGLLMLTQDIKEGEEDDEDAIPTKHLKLLRCPEGEMADWQLAGLELAPPRDCTEVHLGRTPVSCVSAMLPPTVTSSLSSVLVRTANPQKFSSDVPAAALSSRFGSEEEDDGSKSPSKHASSSSATVDKQRRFSARDFMNSCDFGLLADAAAAAAPPYGVVLAAASADDIDASKSEKQDVVLLGHEDGLVIAWGVFLPSLGTERGVGNRYTPLHSLRIGRCAVSAIHTDNTHGILACGDVSGEVVVWEVVDDKQTPALGACAKLRREKVMAQYRAAAAAAASVSASSSSSGGGAAAPAPTADEPADEEPIEVPFMPNSLREAFRVNVSSTVTALLLISEATLLVVGTEGGAVYFNSTLAEGDMMAVDMSRVGDRSPVAGLHHGGFYHHHSLKPVVYAILTSGVVCVICMRTHSVIGWNVGPSSVFAQSAANASLGEDANDCGDSASGAVSLSRTSSNAMNVGKCYREGDQRTLRLGVSVCVNEYFIQTPRPETHTLFVAGVPGATDGGEGGAGAAHTSPRRDTYSSSMTRMFSRTSSNQNHSTSNLGPSNTVHVPDTHAHVNPRYLVCVMGAHVLTYDLAKFSIMPKGASQFSGIHADTVGVQPISSHTVVSASVMNYVEDENRAWMQPTPCFVIVDASGFITVMSIRQRKAICHADLLHGVCAPPAKLHSGVLLGSGSVYMLDTHAQMLYSSTIRSVTHILPPQFPLPARVKQMQHYAPDRNKHVLKTGREQAVAANKQNLNNRRKSMIALTSGPTDLDKVFAKTRSPTAELKDTLFAGATMVPNTTSKAVANAQRSVAAARDEMNELGEALADRGERLKLLAAKMEAFKAQAGEYRELSLAHNRQLKERNRALGLGLF